VEVLFALLLVVILLAIAKTLRELAAAKKQKQAAERAALESREAGRRQAAGRQEEYADSLVRICKESLDDFELLPGHLIAAEEFLDQAEARFREGAFAPFWDSIEQAVQELGGFDARVQSIKSRLTTYETLVKQYEGQPPQFPVDRDGVSNLGVSAGTAERLRSTVYQAQCDFPFATIFEQRKANQILVAGFPTLANALALMSSDLQSSIGQLARSVAETRLPLDDSLHAIYMNVANPAALSAQHHKEVMRELKSATTERKALALELLTNWEQNVRRRV
jgi:chemotaxis protein histidine kinase CheA